MTEKTQNRAEKVAALSMIALTEAEAARLEREIPEILALRDALEEGESGAADFAGARSLAQLRADEPQCAGDPQTLRALSKKERDGYLHVVRTVG